MTPSTILDCIGRTPLVPLKRIAAGLPVAIWAKCEHLNPGGSVKDRIALSIASDAEKRGVLSPGATIVEATAGNTGLGLALVAAVRGYKLVCVLPEKMSQDKRDSLRLAGAEVIVTKNAPLSDPDNFQNVARRLAAERGWFLADQFRNLANVRAHETTTGPELLEQTGGEIGAFVAAVGTGGTITGAGRALKAVIPAVHVVMADPVGSGLAGIFRGETPADGAYDVEGIGASTPSEILDFTVIDEAESVSDAESFVMALRLIREEGLFVGGSAGTAVVAAVRQARKGRVTKPIVVVLPDSWDRYRSKPWLRDALCGRS